MNDILLLAGWERYYPFSSQATIRARRKGTKVSYLAGLSVLTGIARGFTGVEGSQIIPVGQHGRQIATTARKGRFGGDGPPGSLARFTSGSIIIEYNFLL